MVRCFDAKTPPSRSGLRSEPRPSGSGFAFALVGQASWPVLRVFPGATISCMLPSGPALVLLAILGAAPAAAQDSASAFQSLAKQADAARDAHQLDKAIDLYKRAVKMKPAWQEGWWNLGSIAYDLDHFDQ